VSTVRKTAVAGRFYPGDAAALSAEIGRCLATAPAGGADMPATAVVLPHAALVYSGAVAGAALRECRVPELAVILCPNHTGLGAPRACHPAGSFLLPGGSVVVDAELSERVAMEAGLTRDAEAHRREHAIEVELPLLQRKSPSLRIAAVCLSVLDYAECEAIGEGLARAVTALGGSEHVLLVASTDMSHYLSAERARVLDELALERVLALDAEGLYRTVREHRISMCGFIPTTAVLVAAKRLGARAGKLCRYAHSGEVTGDPSSVVGYAGVVVT
jgi:AmmeMemoRadiSam system protein B